VRGIGLYTNLYGAKDFPPCEGGCGWRDEKFVLHKPCLHPDSVARRPPLETGRLEEALALNKPLATAY
jgi:hypothetical protein